MYVCMYVCMFLFRSSLFLSFGRQMLLLNSCQFLSPSYRVFIAGVLMLTQNDGIHSPLGRVLGLNTDWVTQFFQQMWNCCTSVVLLFHIIKFCECVLEHAFLRSVRSKLSQMGRSLSWFTDQAMHSKAETNQGCTKALSANSLQRTTMSLSVPEIIKVS